MTGRTWKNVGASVAENIKGYLLETGGTEVEVKNPNEEWRVKFSDSTFTYYKKGTLYSTPSNSEDPAVYEAWKFIDSQTTSPYVPPTREFLIGLDETGKGELVGHTVLTGVIFPKDLSSEIDRLVGPADTKKHHEFDYWDRIFKELDRLRPRGFDFIMQKIPPWYVDKYNINKILDVTYQRILSTFFRKAEIAKCRIVLDDYGFGPTLKRFLRFLEKQGAEVVVTTHADEKYLEAKAASLVSKREREAVMRAINEREDFKVDGLSIGSGNAGDKQTIEWIQRWYNSGKPWPWFIKRSFKTMWKLEGRREAPRKVTPPIRDEILSDEFVGEFNRGHLSVQSLSLVCPNCGSVLRSARFAIYDKNGRTVSELRCPDTKCAHIIENAGPTLGFYCGFVVPDSNVIHRHLLSKDLEASRFFENFTVILDPVVRKECDGTASGKKEFDELRRFHGIGRIRLESPGSVDDVPDSLSNIERDERIANSCLNNDAILLSADIGLTTFAAGKNIFTIFI